MKLIETEIECRRFHVYVFNQESQLENEKIIFQNIYDLNIGKLFRLIKTSLDMKCEVLILNNFSYSKYYSQLHKFHHEYKQENHLYLNISIKNKITIFFDDNDVVNEFKNLEVNNKLINFFS